MSTPINPNFSFPRGTRVKVWHRRKWYAAVYNGCDEQRFDHYALEDGTTVVMPQWQSNSHVIRDEAA